MSRKKIMFFIESLAGGGAEKVLTDIVTNLDDKKYQLTVFTVTDEDIYEKKVSQYCEYKSFLHKKKYRKGGIEKFFYWLGIKFIYNFPERLIYSYFIKDKYDVEVAFVEGFATKLIASSSNKKSKKLAWVHTDFLHNNYADLYYKNLKKHRLAYQKFDSIICVSQNVRKSFEEKMFRSDKIFVQYNPINEMEILHLSRDTMCRVVQRPLLASIGRLEKQKGYLRLLQCIKCLCDEGYTFELWIIGEGSQRQELDQFINDNGLQNKVQLMGFHLNPYRYMAYCDAFICSSYAEGFSTAAVESLILGKPIFTVECSGMRELFGNKCCGEIVENSTPALYEILKRIVSGKIDFGYYRKDISIRSHFFCLQKRMDELENLLS